MEETKYYTPAPEDIRMGFVYERQDSIMTDMWRPRTITEWGHIFYVLSDISDGGYRVPYLTAEQIEAEGWSKKGDQSDYLWGDGDEEHYTMHHSVAFNEVVINKHTFDEYTSSMRKQLVYFGTCRCINDLRLISKLLGI